MDLFWFIILIILSIISYGGSIYKIYKNEGSESVSIEANVIAAVVSIVLYINAESKYIEWINILQLILVFTLMYFIIYYWKARILKLKRLMKTIKENNAFKLGLIGSLFGIFGVAQGVKCKQNRTRKTEVSMLMYTMSILYGIIIIKLATSNFVIMAEVLSIMMYFYIVYMVRSKGE